MGKTAFIFPGQGSQYVGMASHLLESCPKAREILDTASSIVGWDVIQVSNDEEELKKTLIAQPAIFTVSAAMLQVLTDAGLKPDFVAGHSLGEYSALLAVGVLDFEDLLSLVKKRAHLMQEVASREEGSMSAVIGLAPEEINRVLVRCSQSRVVIANYNCPGQVVISGPTLKIEMCERELVETGARKVVRLQVSGAFHSAAMESAQLELNDYLYSLSFSDPVVPVISNSTGKASRTAVEVKAALMKQMTGPVKWQESVEEMIWGGTTKFIEVGPGRVLLGLVKRCSGDVELKHFEDVVSMARVNNL